MTMNWGTGIATAYLTFAAATTGFVAFAMSRPVLLVSPDYYADSLHEDEHLVARRNAMALGSTAGVSTNGRDRIHVGIPLSQASVAQGSVTLYRASDPAADRTIALSVDSAGWQDLNVSEIARGAWLVQLRWSADGRDYNIEQAVVLK
jgi:hypothetical protein